VIRGLDRNPQYRADIREASVRCWGSQLRTIFHYIARYFRVDLPAGEIEFQNNDYEAQSGREHLAMSRAMH
jgi:hypothetical protein